MEAAPYFAEQSRFDGPVDTLWQTTRDGVRVRLGHYVCTGPARGTVLLFPGRTEHIEKYGPVAQTLTAAGWHVVTIDWRGQGLSERALPNPLIGHIGAFGDYQHDVAALMDLVAARGLPGPYPMIAHSMGGAIGLRALAGGLPASAAAFSAPMWGIQMAPALRPVAWAVGWLGHRLGLGRLRAPGTSGECYLATAPFADNSLTTDAEMWEWMQGHLRERPELQLAGPSITWLYEALAECRALAALPSPQVPCLTVLGSEETIVDPDAIRSRMADWPGGALSLLEGKRHEVLMETPETRAGVMTAITSLFDRPERG